MVSEKLFWGCEELFWAQGFQVCPCLPFSFDGFPYLSLSGNTIRCSICIFGSDECGLFNSNLRMPCFRDMFILFEMWEPRGLIETVEDCQAFWASVFPACAGLGHHFRLSFGHLGAWAYQQYGQSQDPDLWLSCKQGFTFRDAFPPWVSKLWA